VTIGEPEIGRLRDEASGTVTVEVRGLDTWDSINNWLAARLVENIAYWMLDDDYDGSNFLVRRFSSAAARRVNLKSGALDAKSRANPAHRAG
jgi:hypothetical protein